MEKTKVRNIIEKLRSIDGLSNVYLLKEEDKDIIMNMEGEENGGVHECLDRKFVIMVTHNSDFRKPEGEIAKEKNGKTIFPGVPFSEVNARNVVSSSPGKEAHDFLVKRFNLNLYDDATLLIGFDL